MKDSLTLVRFRFAARMISGYIAELGRSDAERATLNLIATDRLSAETRAALWTAFGSRNLLLIDVGCDL